MNVRALLCLCVVVFVIRVRGYFGILHGFQASIENELTHLEGISFQYIQIVSEEGLEVTVKVIMQLLLRQYVCIYLGADYSFIFYPKAHHLMWQVSHIA